MSPSNPDAPGLGDRSIGNATAAVADSAEILHLMRKGERHTQEALELTRRMLDVSASMARSMANISTALAAMREIAGAAASNSAAQLSRVAGHLERLQETIAKGMLQLASRPSDDGVRMVDLNRLPPRERPVPGMPWPTWDQFLAMPQLRKKGAGCRLRSVLAVIRSHPMGGKVSVEEALKALPGRRGVGPAIRRLAEQALAGWRQAQS